MNVKLGNLNSYYQSKSRSYNPSPHDVHGVIWAFDTTIPPITKVVEDFTVVTSSAASTISRDMTSHSGHPRNTKAAGPFDESMGLSIVPKPESRENADGTEKPYQPTDEDLKRMAEQDELMRIMAPIEKHPLPIIPHVPPRAVVSAEDARQTLESVRAATRLDGNNPADLLHSQAQPQEIPDIHDVPLASWVDTIVGSEKNFAEAAKQVPETLKSTKNYLETLNRADHLEKYFAHEIERKIGLVQAGAPQTVLEGTADEIQFYVDYLNSLTYQLMPVAPSGAH